METTPKTTLFAFGKEYCLQGVYENAQQLAEVIAHWKLLGHGTMVKKTNILYVTRFKQG